MDKKNKISFKYIIFIFFIYALVFQDFLQNKIQIFKFLDEGIALLFFSVFIIRFKKMNIKKYDILTFFASVILIIVGIKANLTNGYQTFSIIYSDMLIVFKFILTFYFFLIFFENINFTKYNNKIYFHVSLITKILMIFFIADAVLDIYPYETRYGLKAIKLFYSHSTYLVAVSIFLLTIIIKTFDRSKNGFLKYVDTIFLLILCASTLRMKAIAFILVAIFLIYLIVLRNKKINVLKLIPIAILVIIIAFDQIEFYFSNTEDTAREKLLFTSLNIAKDNFPIGTGFATFGSYYSGVEYSEVYYKYDLENIYGLIPGKANFIADSFWPMLLGQFGVLGLLAYVYILYTIYRRIQYIKDNKFLYCSSLISFIYLLISSTSESAFSSPIAIPLMMIIAVNLSEERKTE